MPIALVALVIAVGSLTWNISSTIYSWRFSRPDIEVMPISGWEHDIDFLDVEVRNKGGSPVGVTRVIVNCYFTKWWQRNYRPRRHGWLRRIVSEGGFGPMSSTGSVKKDRHFFCTIQAYHSETWRFDKAFILKEWLKFPEHTKKLRIDVWLATGKQVRKTMNAEGFPGEVDLLVNKKKYLAGLDEPDQPQLPFEEQ